MSGVYMGFGARLTSITLSGAIACVLTQAAWSDTLGAKYRTCLSAQSDSIEQVKLSTNGRYAAATVRFGSVVKLWEIGKPEEWPFKCAIPVDLDHGFLARGISALSFSPDATELATVSGDGQLRIWDVARAQVKQMPKFPHPVSQVSYIPESKWLITSDSNGDVTLWRSDEGARQISEGSGHPIFGLKSAAGGRYVMWIDIDYVLNSVDVVTAQRHQTSPIRDLNERVWATSSVGDMIIGREALHGIRIWDTAKGLPLSPTVQAPYAFDMVFFDQDKRIAVNDGTSILLFESAEVFAADLVKPSPLTLELNVPVPSNPKGFVSLKPEKFFMAPVTQGLLLASSDGPGLDVVVVWSIEGLMPRPR